MIPIITGAAINLMREVVYRLQSTLRDPDVAFAP